jgi:hypothetical protein
MTTAIERLRELAEGATPGPWEIDDGLMLYTETPRGTLTLLEMGSENTCDEANGRFIATANPAVVLALLDVVEAAERVAGGNEQVRAAMEALTEALNGK